MAKGIDVYGKYQTVTDWTKVRAAGYEFAYVKLSDGETNRDDYGYIQQGKNSGVVMGGYHYAQPGDAVAQADRIIGRCQDEGGLDLAPALDLEDPFEPNTTAVNFAQSFLDRIAERGHRQCLYANNSMMSYLLPRLRLQDGWHWVAKYSSVQPTVRWDVWQHSQSGVVPGIVQLTDLNTGEIPWNHMEIPIPAIGGNDVGFAIPCRPGKNLHVSIPAEGAPPYLYAHTSYGDKFRIRQIDYVRQTPKNSPEPDFVPGKGFHCGDDRLGDGGTPWKIDPSRPGVIVDMTGWGVVQVNVRYDNDTDQDIYLSVG